MNTIVESAKTATRNAYKAASTDDWVLGLLTDEMRGLLQQHKQIDAEDPVCIFRYFSLISQAEFYIIDVDGPNTFWAYVSLGDRRYAEIGTITLDTLQNPKHMIELDRTFEPKPLSEVKRSAR